MKPSLLLPLLLVATAARAATFSAGPPIEVSVSNAFEDCTSDNVLLQNGQNYSNSAVECWIAVNPADSNNIVGVWQQDRWNNGGSRGTVAGVSTNGGASWQSVAIPGLTLCSGGSFERASDPWISFAPNGDLYQISLAFDEDLPDGGFGHNAVLASKSTDGGLNWSEPVTLTDTNDPAVLNDKETITADPADTNLAYAVWDRLQPWPSNPAAFSGPALFSRTTDGGQTWEAPRVIFKPGKNNQTLGNQIVIPASGRLVNGFCEIRNIRGGRTHYYAAALISRDKGDTWKPRRRAARMFSRGAYSSDHFSVFDPETNVGIRTADIIPQIAADPRTNTLYMVWQDARFSNNGHFSNVDLLIDEIAFSQSTDGGVHWSRPIKINQTPTNIALANRQAFTPAIRAAADGTIAVTYYDFRNNDAGAELWTDVFAVFCTPSALTPANKASSWGNEVRLTDASFDFRQAPIADGYFVGDYGGLAATGNDFLALFCQPHDTDPSTVFFRRLSP